MADWKYIAYDLYDGATRRVPIIFPHSLAHVDVAKALNPMMSNRGRRSAPVVSAGFVGGLACLDVHGESESLSGLKCDEIDSEVINTMPVQLGILDALMPGVETMILMEHIKRVMDHLRSQV